MTFADFLGNPRVVAALRRMLESGRVPHALLFSGQSGVGKFTLATLFARAANCLHKPGEGCETCDNCRALPPLNDLEELTNAALAARGSASPEQVPLILRPHPCLSVLVPDGAFIRVAQMRYVVNEAYRMPSAGRRQVFIIDQAERLRSDFADVLLKVLEEPPDHTTLILVTAEPYQLRATIRSRCVSLYFAPLPQEEIESYLENHRSGWKKADRQLAAAAAAGSLGTALGLDLELYRGKRSQAIELVTAAIQPDSDPQRLFEATAELAGKGERGETASAQAARQGFEFSLDILYSLLTDIVYWKVGTPGCGLHHPDLGSELQKVSRQVNWDWLSQAVAQLDRLDKWQRRNVNRQLGLDAWALGPASRI